MNQLAQANPPSLDPVLHQPVRTRLAAFLAARGEATFSELKAALETTDGNLDSHIKKLTAAGYLLTHKQQGEGRPQTLYALSHTGMTAFAHYVQTLNALLDPEALAENPLYTDIKMELT